MAEHQELALRLASAGYAPHPDEKESTFILSVDNGSLVSKLFSGPSVREQELVATPVRPKSTAAYLVISDDRVVIYISSDSTIHATRYDGDEDEWVEVSGTPSNRVHPQGNLSAALLPDGGIGISYQDPTGKLVFLPSPSSPKAITLPANATIGTPLSISAGKDELRIYYVSSEDNFIHYTTLRNGEWSDHILAQLAIKGTPRGFVLGMEDETGLNFTAYILTDEGALVTMNQESKELSKLGTIDDKGKFTPGTSAECCWGVPVYCVRPVWGGYYTQTINISVTTTYGYYGCY